MGGASAQTAPGRHLVLAQCGTSSYSVADTFFAVSLFTSSSKASSVFSTLPHLSTARRMCPWTIFTPAFLTMTTESIPMSAFWFSRSERITEPEASPQRTSKNLPPLESTSLGSSRTFIFRLRPLESGITSMTFPNVGFFRGFSGLIASAIFFCTGSAFSAVIISLALGGYLCSPSSVILGTMWKCGWNTSCPEAAPLFCQMFTPAAPVACFTAEATFCRSRRNSEAFAGGMSMNSL
mmetsp:Transcript_34941/g.104579  ORF Transcript_34941/g.104579 Transcript_34941/m.104579 type:complete len:237 (+) Transcript_34941:3-713(+)